MYHSNSLHGKLQAILESDKCVCGNHKKPNKPFCIDCYNELKEMDYSTINNLTYNSGTDLLDEMDSAIQELGIRYNLN